MNIGNTVSQINELSSNFESNFNPKEKINNNAFEQVLGAALGIFNETNNYQKLADIAQLDFAAGRNDNMLSVLMAEQKAYTSLDFTVQVTNKVIEAYREIMRIQL